MPFVHSFKEASLNSNLNCTFTYCEMCRETLEKIKKEKARIESALQAGFAILNADQTHDKA